MSAGDTVQRTVDATHLAVGAAGTAASWMTWAADLDIWLRILVSGLTAIYLCVAIYHRVRPKLVPVRETEDDVQ